MPMSRFAQLRVLGIGSWAGLVLAAAAWLGCSQSTAPTQPAAGKTGSQGDAAMKITVSSTAFAAGERIPKKYTGEGADVSPPLAWSGGPAGTKEYALIMDDPDAPAGTWVHWVLYKIPPTTTSLKEGVPTTAALKEPSGALQGKNSSKATGYHGPMPPPGHGTHHYHFKAYALGEALELPAGATKQQLLDAMRGHILAEGELVGTYSR
jgi:Raf kinase inhibitor-like YbhB/YbcL family protein